MENNEVIVKEKSNKGLKVLLVILILIVLCLSGYLVYDKFIANDETPKSADKNDTDTKNKDIDVTTKKINIKEAIDSDSSIKLNDNFTIKFAKMTEEEELTAGNTLAGDYHFNLFVNGKFVISDWRFAADATDNYEIMYNNNYLIFTTVGTDIRSTNIYVVSTEGKVTQTFHELDDIKGMVPESYTIKDNKLIIEATRITHGPSIEYYDTLYETCEQLKSLDENLAVKETYTYEFKNKKFELENKNTNYTLKQFISDYKKECLN